MNFDLLGAFMAPNFGPWRGMAMEVVAVHDDDTVTLYRYTDDTEYRVHLNGLDAS